MVSVMRKLGPACDSGRAPHTTDTRPNLVKTTDPFLSIMFANAHTKMQRIMILALGR